MDRIVLKITGTQQAGMQKDKTELTTIGTLRDDGLAYIVKYTEECEPPYSPVDVTVRIQKDESFVEMRRSGEHGSCLTIEKAKRNLCHYGTEFGGILMGIYGRDIEAGEVQDGCGSFTFRYDIDINGAVASKNTVNMTFSKNQQN